MLVLAPTATVAVSPFSVFTVAVPLSNFSTVARSRVGGAGGGPPVILSCANDGSAVSIRAAAIKTILACLIETLPMFCSRRL